MRIIVLLALLLTCLAPVWTGEEDSPVVARLRVLLGRISRLSAMQQNEGRLFCTDEYRDLAQFGQKNIAPPGTLSVWS